MEKLYKIADALADAVTKWKETTDVSIPQDARGEPDEERAAFVFELENGERYHVALTKLSE
jgi:hypothetical protein